MSRVAAGFGCALALLLALAALGQSQAAAPFGGGPFPDSQMYLPLSGGTLTGALILPDGAVATPALKGSDSDTGVFFNASGANVNIGVNGTQYLQVNSSFTNMGNAPLAPNIDSDKTSTCTTGEMGVDIGGANKEWCYCFTTNTWYCVNFTNLTGPAD